MFCQQCPICASDIDLGSKDWRAFYQELRSTDSSDTPAQSLPTPTGATPADTHASLVHYTCWRIACLQGSVLEFNSSQFLLLERCMPDLAPLQSRLCSADRPDESGLYDFPKAHLSSRPPAWGTLDCLPYELRCQIIDNLANLLDVDNFARATGACFPSSLLRNICWQSFGVNLDTVQLRHIVQALSNSPSLMNHTIIWENVKLILKHMDRSFYGIDFTPVLPKLNLTWPVSSALRTAKIMQMNGRHSHVDFHFCLFGTVSYLTGVGVNNALVGYRGDQVHTEELPPAFTGIRLIFNQIGINAIQVKTDTGWSAIAGGHGIDDIKKGEQAFFSESWDLVKSDILAYFDVLYPESNIPVALLTCMVC